MNEIVGAINGKLVSHEHFNIPFYDLTVMRGIGAFDYLVTYNQQPFRLREHILRFLQSAETLHIPIPYTVEQMSEWVNSLLEVARSRYQEMGIRIIGTAGMGDSSLTIGSNGSVFIGVENRGMLPKEYYENGVRCVLHEHQRSCPAAKSTMYLEAVLQMPRVKAAGAAEVIYHADGLALEGATSNLFIVKRGELYTPLNRVLGGITSQFVIDELCSDLVINQGDLLVGDVLTADEVFVTASNKEILPVVEIDEKQIGDGEVGPVTKKLMGRFHELTRGSQ